MHHFNDYEKAFAEIYRVCKKGGRIVLGPESHRYSLDQYIYNTVFRYWRVEKGILKLTPRKLRRLFKDFGMSNIRYYHKGIDPVAVNPLIEKTFDGLTDILPNFLFFWAHFYITGVK
jgi:ubiquinone/menaquinone biosynthesis C-methylase UbiE